MIEQDIRNKDACLKNTAKIPNDTNTSTGIIPAKLKVDMFLLNFINNIFFYCAFHRISKRKPLNKRSEKDSHRYLCQDQLEREMLNKPTHAIFELIYKVMGIDVENTPDRLDRCRLRQRFLSDVQFKFPVGSLTCERHGSTGK